MEVLQKMLEHFETKIQCSGSHSKLLKDISMRVKILKRLRDFLEDIFGLDDEGHRFVNAYELAKVRMDLRRWEDIISDCYIVLRALRGPVEMLGAIFKEPEHKTNIKIAIVDLSIIMDNFQMPLGW